MSRGRGDITIDAATVVRLRRKAQRAAGTVHVEDADAAIALAHDLLRVLDGERARSQTGSKSTTRRAAADRWRDSGLTPTGARAAEVLATFVGQWLDRFAAPAEDPTMWADIARAVVLQVAHERGAFAAHVRWRQAQRRRTS